MSGILVLCLIFLEPLRAGDDALYQVADLAYSLTIHLLVEAHSVLYDLGFKHNPTQLIGIDLVLIKFSQWLLSFISVLCHVNISLRGSLILDLLLNFT